MPSGRGGDRVRALARSADTAGVFLDFDGTLSEIVEVPSRARPVEGAREALDRVAVRFKVTAVVSGRSAAELLEWLGPKVEIWGVHGAQRTIDGEVVLSERTAPYAGLMERVHDEAQEAVAALGLEGVVVEDKAVMVGLHFRAAEDVETARRRLDQLAEDLARRHGLRRGGGRLVYELRPPVELSKSTVVLERARDANLRAAMFIGDDRVDLPAFDALDELAGEGLDTVRVGVDSDEAPPELLERADVVVDGPPGVVDLLLSLGG